MKRNHIFGGILLGHVSYILPLVVRAQGTETIEGIISKITTEILNPLIVLLFALATLVFVFGLIQFVMGSQGNASALETGKKAILWGLIGMFIMASAWSIVRLFCDFFFSDESCI